MGNTSGDDIATSKSAEDMGSGDKTAGDRSRPVSARIVEALLELMTEKAFAEITVTDVVRRAQVARASFYRNFSSTSDVLDAVMDGLVSQFRDTALPVIASQDERRWRAFLFRYLYLASERRQRILFSRTSNASIVLYRLADVAHEIVQQQQFDSIKEKYSVSTRVAIINSVVLRWLDDGQRETPEEIVDYLMGFVLDI